ncbi:MAG TPA: PIN domain-containing protein [Candidatus Nanoarchaeia archaeon]
MNIQILFRVTLGVGFAALGYFVSDRFLNIADPGVKTGMSVIITVASGAAGVFLVPLISRWIGYWSSVFAQRIANEVISQLRLPTLSDVRELPGRIPRPGGKKKEEAGFINPILVDTSALIDGRVADVAESGFLYGTLIVPQFILSELQHIADASNALRRGRGRRGLEVLEGLKRSKQVKTVIYDVSDPKGKNIDEKLLNLAKALKAKILTTDFNLNKVATVSGIKILNINELVNLLKTTLLPGEQLEVNVISGGKEKTQGVGYLSDGTMIVVENGARFIGKSAPTVVLRVLQTAAGRMIFTQVDEKEKKQGKAEI